MFLNKAIIFGNLTRDPELRSLPSGVPVVTFSLATNRIWKDKDGNRQESADFHNIVVFGRQAETVNQYLKKGSSALVEGRIQTRSWEGNDGNKRYTTEIVADRVQFGPKRDSSGSSGRGAANDDNQDTKQNDVDTIEYPEEDIKPEDIPF